MSHLTLAIDYLPPETLTSNPRNPRIHSKKQLRQLTESIRRFGFVVPILVDKNRQVIAGHGRLLAAREAGMAQVPVICADHLNPAEAQAFMIADNRLTENARWDEALLKEHFIELSRLELDFDLEITGFDTAEIDLFILDEGKGDAQETQEEEVVSAGPPICRPGDLWGLGSHRILCADSLLPTSYGKLLGDTKVQMVFTDPPYNVPVQGHVSGLGKHQHREFAMASGEMSSSEFQQFLQTVLQRFTEVSTSGSLHYICMDWRHLQDLLSAGQHCYDSLRNICVWVKDNGGMGSLYRSRHEMVAVFRNGSAPHCNTVELGKHGRYRTNVWEYAGASSFARLDSEEGDLLALHPTVKPVNLVADAILDCTRRGWAVLDAFLGSGTTLIAAEKTGRCCFGIELDPLYVDTAIRRWQTWTGQEAVHTESGKTFAELEASYEA